MSTLHCIQRFVTFPALELTLINSDTVEEQAMKRKLVKSVGIDL